MTVTGVGANTWRISTVLGNVDLEVVNAATIKASGRVTIHSAQYTVDLTVYRQGMYGFYRRSFDDLQLTPVKEGKTTSFPDRERALDVLVQAINDWAESKAGIAALAAPPPQQHSPADLKRGDL